MDTPLYTLTVLALNTGMRHKEIRTLYWKDINLETGVLRVAESKTKSGVGRPIPLTPPALAALRYWADRFPERRPEHFAFPACEKTDRLILLAVSPTGARRGGALRNQFSALRATRLRIPARRVATWNAALR